MLEKVGLWYVIVIFVCISYVFGDEENVLFWVDGLWR